MKSIKELKKEDVEKIKMIVFYVTLKGKLLPADKLMQAILSLKHTTL